MVDKKSRGRRSAEQTRAEMLDAGIAQLEREGVKYGLDHLTLEAACSVANIARSSSHAAWAIDDDFTPQAMYQRSVLKRWIFEREEMIADAATVALTAAFDERGGSLTKGEIIRISIQAALEAAVEPDENGVGSGFLSTDMALKHALASQSTDGRDPDIADWVRDAEVRQRDQRVEDTYRPLAALIGLQPRPEFGDAAYEHLALAVATLIEGIGMRHIVIPDRNYAGRSIIDVGDGGVPATLLGVCVEALVDRFFEAQPAGVASPEPG